MHAALRLGRRARRVAAPSGWLPQTLQPPRVHLGQRQVCKAAGTSEDDPQPAHGAGTQHVAGTSQPSLDETSQPALTSEDKLQLGVLFSTSLLVQLGIGVIIPVLPAYAQSVGLTATDVGLVVAVPSFASALLNLPVGRLVDVVGRKRPMIYGSLIDGVGCFATALAGGLNSMVGARLLMGSGSAISYTACEAYTLDVVGKFPAHKGRLMGAVGAVGSLAFVAGPAIGGAMAERGGIAAPFALIGVSVMLTAPLLSLLPETRPPTAPLSSLRPGPMLADARHSFGSLLADRNQQALLLVQSSLFTGWSASLTVLPLWAAATWDATPASLGTLYSTMAVMGFVGAPLGGALSDKVGRKTAIGLGSAACAAGFGALPALESMESLYGAACLIGLGESCLMSGVGAMSSDVTRAEQRGAQSALLKQVGDVTFVVMPVTLAAVATHVSFGAAFLCTASVMVCANGGFLCLALLPAVRRPPV